ncbi:MATE family efflux transporter [Vallitalea okinawensis]|uniref:MATE family efflux transporter n=1 Tax=Vallitalea okinawensis TaxID=2078660 RepID=UPI000CFB010C|nr:MATE family efflux transporter [Vallitalea okinawensis]
MNQTTLGTQNIHKLFARFTIPAVIAMVISGSQSIIDGIFVGNYVGQNALASINMAIPFTQIIVGLSMVISMGALSFIGRSMGEGNINKAQNIFKTATNLNLIIMISIAVIALLFNKQLASLFGASSVILDDVSIYIKIFGLFAPFISTMFLFGFTDRIMGKPNIYLIGSIFSLVINVLLDFILIKYLNLGVKGAALASGIAYSTAFLVVIWPMLNKNSTLNIFVGSFDRTTILPMVYNGSSEAVSSAAAAITIFIFNNIFMRIAGEAGVAAYTTISYISQFSSFIMFGISDGIGPLLSYNYGQGNLDRVKKTLKLSIIVNTTVGVFLFIVLNIFGRQLISLFVDDGSQVIEIAVSGARLFAITLLMNGFNIINSGYFTAIGNARNSILIAISRGLIFIIIGLVILPAILGLSGVWLTVPFAEAVTFIIGIILFRKQLQKDAENFSLKEDEKKKYAINKMVTD